LPARRRRVAGRPASGQEARQLGRDGEGVAEIRRPAAEAFKPPDQLKDIAAGATAEAMPKLAVTVDAEARSPLIMERT